jgi:hypothetical protein
MGVGKARVMIKITPVWFSLWTNSCSSPHPKPMECVVYKRGRKVIYGEIHGARGMLSHKRVPVPLVCWYLRPAEFRKRIRCTCSLFQPREKSLFAQFHSTQLRRILQDNKLQYFNIRTSIIFDLQAYYSPLQAPLLSPPQGGLRTSEVPAIHQLL